MSGRRTGIGEERVLGFAEAVACVRAHSAEISLSSVESVPLRNAAGRVLARDVLADREFPPFRRSTRDGFAVMAGRGREFRLLGEVRAGERWTGPAIGPGTCVAIMTGAPVPEGADAVVMVEHCSCAGDRIALVEGRKALAGQNIVEPGSEALPGRTVVRAGTRLAAAHLGMAAACGETELAVYARPRVAILATGDELVDVQEKPGPQQIRNSNSYGLAAAVEAAGAQAVILDVARDTFASLKEQLRLAFECDLVVIAGGVSAGKYDLAEQVLEESFGAEFFFTGVRMQPGRPAVFGRTGSERSGSREASSEKSSSREASSEKSSSGGTSKGDAWNGQASCEKYFFGLPGNPVSALVTFGLLARPLLAALCGEAAWQPRMLSARLEEDVEVAAGLTRFFPAWVSYSLEGATVRLVPWRGSGDMAALAASNAFLVVPEDASLLRAGAIVTVWLAG